MSNALSDRQGMERYREENEEYILAVRRLIVNETNEDAATRSVKAIVVPVRIC
jgi:hypothetical protein